MGQLSFADRCGGHSPRKLGAHPLAGHNWPSTWIPSRCARPPSSSSTWRPPAAAPPATEPRRDHRDRRGQGARRRGARRTRHTRRSAAASIPPQIVALTGITSAMVCDAPDHRLGAAAFLEFSRGAVLVAHNAGFDIGFLRAAAERCQITWPRPPVLCTVRLARRVLTRDEAPERAAVRAGAVVRRGHHTDAPGARRRPRHRRRAARADRAGRQPGCAHLHRPAGVSARCDAGAAAQAASRRRRCRTGPASTCSAGPSARGALRRNGGRSAQTGRPVLQRRRPAHPHQGDGRRWRPRSTTSSARTTSRPACASCGCSPPTRRRTTAGRSFRTAGGGWCSPTRRFRGSRWCAHRASTTRADRPVPVPRRRRRDGRAAGPVHGRAHVHHAAGPLRAARAACPEREVSPCPAPRGVTADRSTPRRPRAPSTLIDGQRQPRARRGTRAHRRPGRAQPLRDRRPAARPRRRRDRRAVARPAAARAGRGRRAGRRRARTATAAGTSR